MAPSTTKLQPEMHELQGISSTHQSQQTSSSDSTQSSTDSAPSTGSGQPETSGSRQTSLYLTFGHFSTTLRTRLTQAWEGLCKAYKSRGPLLLKVAVTVLGLLFAALAIWPGYSSANDGRKAELIAEWTARKDFIEACEAHDWFTVSCENAKGTQLEAPPNFDRTEWKRYFKEHYATKHTNSSATTMDRISTFIISLGLPMSACLSLLLRRRLARAIAGVYSRITPLYDAPGCLDIATERHQGEILSWDLGTQPMVIAESTSISFGPTRLTAAAVKDHYRGTFKSGENDELVRNLICTSNLDRSLTGPRSCSCTECLRFQKFRLERLELFRNIP